VNFVEVAQLIARDEISEHGEERERKAEEHRDAADARFRLFVHPPLADFVDHTDVSREFAHEGRRECRRDAREQNDDAEDRQQRSGVKPGSRPAPYVLDGNACFGQQCGCDLIGISRFVHDPHYARTDEEFRAVHAGLVRAVGRGPG